MGADVAHVAVGQVGERVGDLSVATRAIADQSVNDPLAGAIYPEVLALGEQNGSTRSDNSAELPECPLGVGQVRHHPDADERGVGVVVCGHRATLEIDLLQ